MKVKCRNVEYDLNKQDEILFNGACYQIITRKTHSVSGGIYIPLIAKAKAKKMIKDNKLIFKEKRKFGTGTKLDIYMINNQEE